jgi:23S rRNA pseudouridine1911/1915/1917 synthase
MSQLSVQPNSNISFSVLKETPGFLAIDKPAGVPTQPGVKHLHDTLLNGLFAQYGHELQNLGKKRDFGLLHRLDLAVSGIVLVGRTTQGYDHLRTLFVNRAIEKTYLCLVHGTLTGAGSVTHAIREVRLKGEKTAQLGKHPRAKEAKTDFEGLASSQGLSLVKCTILSGRLHQIRIHMASLGHPVLGDLKYGRQTPRDRALGRGRIALHATSVRFNEQGKRKKTKINSPFPADLEALVLKSGMNLR